MPDSRDFSSVRPLLLVLAGLCLLLGPVSADAAAGERHPDSGALDLDVRPETVEVYVNGQYVGIADAFDGFPRYLWLDPGEYRVVFYQPGFRTMAREFTVGAGQVVRVRTRLDKGETVAPEALFEKPTVRADARLQADLDRAASASDRWAEEAGAAPQSQADVDLRSDPPRLFVRVQPDDAAIYLDGRFLGTGRDLDSLHSGLLVDVGAHVLEIVRPGFETRTVEFEGISGEDERLDIELLEGR